MRTTLALCIATLLSAALSAGAQAATLFVDQANPNCPGSGTSNDPFCKIQDGILAANPGDTVQVAAGVYVETIDFLGKAIVVESVSGPSSTTIDANRLGSCVTFTSNEGPQSILRGFRLVNGLGTAVTGPFGNTIWSGLGAFIRNASPTLEANEITGHQLSSSTALTMHGAGIYAESGSPTIRENIVSDNIASYGGGLFATLCPNLSIMNNYFTCNEGVGTGAALELRDCLNASIVGNDFNRNGKPSTLGPPTSSGASINLSKCQGLNFHDNEIWDNRVEDEGILYLVDCSGDVQGNVIRENGAGSICGFVLSNCSGLRFADNLISGNSGGIVGGGQINGGSDLVFERNRFVANSAGLASGLQTNTSQPLVIRRCIFEQHLAPHTSNTALRLSNGATSVEDCIFDGNGYGLVPSTGNQIRRSTFWNNSFGAIYVEVTSASSISLESSVLYQNGAAASGTEILTTSGTLTVSDSLVTGGYPGTNVINANPLFANTASGDFRLGTGSPCIDMGSAFDAACGVDFAGAPRRVSGVFGLTARVDMGAHEYSQVVLRVDKLAGLNTFQLTSDGAAGQPTLMFASVATTELCAIPAGTLLVDLGAPSAIVPWMPLPSQQQVVAPAIPVSELYLQQLVLGPTSGTGNLSARATLELD